MKRSYTLDNPLFGVIGAVWGGEGGGYLNNCTLNNPFFSIMGVVYGEYL